MSKKKGGDDDDDEDDEEEVELDFLHDSDEEEVKLPLGEKKVEKTREEIMADMKKLKMWADMSKNLTAKPGGGGFGKPLAAKADLPSKLSFHDSKLPSVQDKKKTEEKSNADEKSADKPADNTVSSGAAASSDGAAASTDGATGEQKEQPGEDNKDDAPPKKGCCALS